MLLSSKNEEKLILAESQKIQDLIHPSPSKIEEEDDDTVEAGAERGSKAEEKYLNSEIEKLKDKYMQMNMPKKEMKKSNSKSVLTVGSIPSIIPN